jgi:hypothetical protein
MAQVTPAQPSGNDLPPESIRTWISLLLFIHLFMVVVAILAYPSPSTLEQRLCSTLAPYLRTFNFNLNHGEYNTSKLHLTHAQDHDIDFKITATTKLPDGKQDVLVIPDPNLGRGLRYSRQLAFANVAGSLAKNEQYEAVLPKAVGASLMLQAGTKNASVMITERRLPTIEDMTAGDEQRRNLNSGNYLRRTYQGNVFRVGPKIEIIKQAATGDVAPATRGAATP